MVSTAGREAEKVGVLGKTRPPVETMWEDVYQEKPWHLERQEQELREEMADSLAAAPPPKREA